MSKMKKFGLGVIFLTPFIMFITYIIGTYLNTNYVDISMFFKKEVNINYFIASVILNEFQLKNMFVIWCFTIVAVILNTVFSGDSIRDIPSKFGFKSDYEGDSEYDRLVKVDDEGYIFESVKGKMDFNRYVSEQENLEQYLGHKIDLERYGSNGIKIYKTQLEEFINVNYEKYKQGKIYFGETKRGSYYTDFIKSKNLMIGGEAGSGKSGVLNNFIINMIVNRDLLHSFYLFDLKDGVESGTWDWIEKYIPNFYMIPNSDVNMLDDELIIEKMLMNVMKNLEYEVKLRSNYMKRNKVRYFADCGLKPIVVWIDEFSVINQINKTKYMDREDKSYREMKDYLISTMEKWVRMWRAFGVKLYISTQRLSQENISGELKANMNNSGLLRVQNSINGNMVIESGVYEKILIGVNPTKFNPGRMILKMETDLELIQTPFVSDEIIKDLKLDFNDTQIVERDNIELRERLKNIIEKYREGEFENINIDINSLEEYYLFNNIYSIDREEIERLETILENDVEEEIVKEVKENLGEDELQENLFRLKKILYERVRNSNMESKRKRFYKDRLDILWKLINKKENLYEVQKDLEDLEKELN